MVKNNTNTTLADAFKKSYHKVGSRSCLDYSLGLLSVEDVTVYVLYITHRGNHYNMTGTSQIRDPNAMKHVNSSAIDGV